MTKKPATGPGTTADPNQANRADPESPPPGKERPPRPSRDPADKPGTTSDPTQSNKT